MRQIIAIVDSEVCSGCGRVVLRLADPTKSLSGDRFLEITIIDTEYLSDGRIKYTIEYDETLLAAPTVALNYCDFTLCCIACEGEYLEEQMQEEVVNVLGEQINEAVQNAVTAELTEQMTLIAENAVNEIISEELEGIAEDVVAAAAAGLQEQIDEFDIHPVQMTFATTSPAGWVFLKGGTIGNAASGGSVLADSSAELLFTHLWNNLANSEAAVSGGRGVSAAADFASGKTLTLPNMTQRVPFGLGASGTGAVLGGVGGALDHTHSVPAHYHGMGAGANLSVDIDHNHAAVNTSTDGDHQHNVTGTAGQTIAWYESSGGNRTAPPLTGTNFGGSTAIANTNGNHFHSVDVPALGATPKTPTGSIGLVTGGVNGNAAMTSGGNNQAFLALNFIIKL
jgi:hypothetical protein